MRKSTPSPAPAKIAPGRALVVICLASAFWAFSFGIGAPLASLWLKQAGASDTLIGLNTAAYYAGLAAAALLVPLAMRRWGLQCTMIGMLVSGITVAVFPWGNSVGWYFGIRFLGGVAAALCLIPMETYVNRDLQPEHRARNFGIYAATLTLGWALGNWVGLQMVASAPVVAFAVGGAASALAALIVKCFLPAIQADGEARPPSVPLDLRDNLLSFGSAWCQGFLEGGLIAFLPLYLLAQGLTEQQAGWLISITLVGVIVFQVPVAWLADLLGRLPVLLGCFALAAVGLVALPLGATSIHLPVWLFIVGASSSSFYPLGLAMLGENLPAGELDRANALYLSVECIGCLTGPALMGIARDQWGEPAMFAVGELAVLLTLACWIVGRRKDAAAACDDGSSESSRRAA